MRISRIWRFLPWGDAALPRRATAERAWVATVTAALRAQFPGCPPDEAARIAEWTSEKHSGRVGRSAGGSV